jgi:hypothetical protein
VRELLLFTVLNKGPRPQTRPSRSHHNSRPHYCLAVERRNNGSGSGSGSNSSSNRLTALRVVPASHGSHPYNYADVPSAPRRKASTFHGFLPWAAPARKRTGRNSAAHYSFNFVILPPACTLYLRTLFLFCCASLPPSLSAFPFRQQPPPPPSPAHSSRGRETSQPLLVQACRFGLLCLLALLSSAFLCFASLSLFLLPTTLLHLQLQKVIRLDLQFVAPEPPRLIVTRAVFG